MCSVIMAAGLAAPVSAAGVRLNAQAANPPDWRPLEAETLRHFQAIQRLDTQNPPGNAYLVTDYIKGVLENEGIPVEIFALER